MCPKLLQIPSQAVSLTSSTLTTAETSALPNLSLAFPSLVQRRAQRTSSNVRRVIPEGSTSSSPKGSFSSTLARDSLTRCPLRIQTHIVAFNVYDLDKDGFISNGELFIVLRTMTGNQLTDMQLQQIVDRTIRDADADGDGRIGFDEFVKFVKEKNSDFLKIWSMADL